MDHSQEFDLAVRARTSRGAERAIRLPERLRTPPCSSSLPRRKPSLAAPLNIPLISPQTPPTPARCPGSTGLSSLLLRDVSVKEGVPLWSLGGPPQPLQFGLLGCSVRALRVREPLFLEHRFMAFSRFSMFAAVSYPLHPCLQPATPAWPTGSCTQADLAISRSELYKATGPHGGGSCSVVEPPTPKQPPGRDQRERSED